MILATVHQPGLSASALRRIQAAKAFLLRTDFSNLPDGTYPVEGDCVYAMVQSFSVTRPIDAPYETHRVYMDVQYVISGELEMMIAPAGVLRVNGAYHPDEDVVFYHPSVSGSHVRLQPGEAAILLPGDAHRMICWPREGETRCIRKCVVKVALD